MCISKKIKSLGTSPAVQWLRLYTSIAGGMGSIPGWKTKIPHAVWSSQKKKKITYSYYYIRECCIQKKLRGEDTRQLQDSGS